MSFVSGILSQEQKSNMWDGQSWPLRGAVEYEELNHTQVQKPEGPRKSEQGLGRSP